jgi:hypothetical protein
MAESTLDKWMRPGSQPVAPTKTADAAPSKPARYEAMKKSEDYPTRLLFKCGPRAVDVALPYAYLAEITTDTWSQISLCFTLPPWPGPRLVLIRGECLGTVADAIIAGTAATVEMFDPVKHIDPDEGIAIIREIEVIDRRPEPGEKTHH